VRLLLDTHAFLWWNTDDGQLSSRAREVIADPASEVFLSAVSAWEIALKWQKGRLVLPEPPESYVASRMVANTFTPLPIDISHAVHVTNLPAIHADPFDRLLIAQACLEDMLLVTADPEINRYDVKILW
jgi:PIN domain nuclease of toxin-antitoxin system